MPETILLIDYENVKDTGLKQLPAHDRIQLFVGKGQKPKIDFVKSVLDDGARLDMIQVAEQGRNNLDFYIAFYLGKLLQEEPNARCIVISNDQDLDPLLAHLKKRGIPCARAGTHPASRLVRAAPVPAPVKPAPVVRPAPVRTTATRQVPVKAVAVRPAPVRPTTARPAITRPAAPKPPERKPAPQPDYDLEDALSFLKSRGKRQPKGRNALVRSLASHLNIKPPEVERIITALMQSGFLTISKDQVSYR